MAAGRGREDFCYGWSPGWACSAPEEVCWWCAVAGGGGSKGVVVDMAGTEAMLRAGTPQEPFCQWGSRWKCWGGRGRAGSGSFWKGEVL